MWASVAPEVRPEKLTTLVNVLACVSRTNVARPDPGDELGGVSSDPNRPNLPWDGANASRLIDAAFATGANARDMTLVMSSFRQLIPRMGVAFRRQWPAYGGPGYECVTTAGRHGARSCRGAAYHRPKGQ